MTMETNFRSIYAHHHWCFVARSISSPTQITALANHPSGLTSNRNAKTADAINLTTDTRQISTKVAPQLANVLMTVTPIFFLIGYDGENEFERVGVRRRVG